MLCRRCGVVRGVRHKSGLCLNCRGYQQKAGANRPVSPCRHCSQLGAAPRHLCYRCYHNNRIRNQYPVERNTNNTFPGSKTPRKEGQPTRALPGSAEKVAILEERVLRGEALWHPQDAVSDDVPGVPSDDGSLLDALASLSP
jgi:hypothetical protein